MNPDDRIAALERDVRQLSHARDVQRVTDDSTIAAINVRVKALEEAAVEQKKTGSMIMKIVAATVIGIVIKFAFTGGFLNVVS